MVDLMTATFLSHTQDIISTEPEYTLAPNVLLLTASDDTVRLLDLGGHFYAIPAVGARMLKAALERDVATAVQDIARQYGVDPQCVQTDLQKFLEDLEKQRLIIHRDAQRLNAWYSTALPALFFVDVLLFVCLTIRSPKAKAWALLALARLSFALLGWAQTLEVWQRYSQLAPQSVPLDRQGELVQEVDESVRWAAAKHVFKVECKERALSCWVLSKCVGVPARLVIGVRVFPFEGHCWCEFGPKIFSDDQDRCQEYVSVAAYA